MEKVLQNWRKTDQNTRWKRGINVLFSDFSKASYMPRICFSSLSHISAAVDIRFSPVQVRNNRQSVELDSGVCRIAATNAKCTSDAANNAAGPGNVLVYASIVAGPDTAMQNAALLRFQATSPNCSPSLQLLWAAAVVLAAGFSPER